MKIKKIFASSLFILIPIPILTTSCSIPLSDNDVTKIKQRALPSVREYDDVTTNKFTINNMTRFINDLGNDDFMPSYNILANEYYQKLLPTDTPLNNSPDVVDNVTQATHDIVIKQVTSLTKYPNINNPEAYQLKISNYVELSVLTTQGVYWGIRTILQMQLTNGGLNYGIITDWPKVSERGIQYDFNGNDWPIEYLNDTIRELSWDKLNTIGLQFASGGVHVSTGKDSTHNSLPFNSQQTWFESSDSTWYNINESSSNNWVWNGINSDFTKSILLAKDYGIKIIPQMELISHASFITNLNAPRYKDGDNIPDGKSIGDIKNDIDITDVEKENDFALYDDSSIPKRIADMVDLTEDKNGSAVVLDLISQMVDYYCDLFKEAGCDSFSIGADEYFESVLSSQGTSRQYNFNSTSSSGLTKQEVVDSFYTATTQIDQKIKEHGMSPRMWNDNLLRNERAQVSNPYFPTPTEGLIDGLDKDMYSQYWWKSKPYDATHYDGNEVASVDDWLGEGFHHMVNFDFDDLYFCTDPASSYQPDPKRLFDSWHPGKFSSNYELNPPVPQMYLEDPATNNYPNWLVGAMMSVWYTYSPTLFILTVDPLKAFSQKCWNGSDNTGSFVNYERTADLLDRAPILV